MPSNLSTIFSIFENQENQGGDSFSPETLAKRAESKRITQLSILIGESRDVTSVADRKYRASKASNDPNDSREPYDDVVTKISRLDGFLRKYCEDHLRIRLIGMDTGPHLAEKKHSATIPGAISKIDQEISQIFSYVNRELKYFPKSFSLDSPEYKLYKKFYLLCQHQAHIIEDSSEETRDETARRAYKMAVLFDSIEDAEKFIDLPSHNSNLSKPVHDIMTIPNLPQCPDFAGPGYDLKGWKRAIAGASEGGEGLALKPMEAFRNIAFARILHDKMVELKMDHFVPQNLAELAYIKRLAIYKRFDEKPELAEIFEHYGVSGDAFDKALDLYASGQLTINPTDNLPNVLINLGEMNSKNKGIYFIKLPKGDPRGLILGDIVTCCQKIGGDAEQCAIEGTQREDTCFYIMVQALDKDKELDYNAIDWGINFEKEYKIIGQSYIWRSDDGNLVADSFESSTFARTLPIAATFKEFARQAFLQQPGISRMLVGGGGGTKSSDLKDLPPASSESFSGYRYPDSYYQLLISEGEQLKQLHEEIKKFSPGERVAKLEFNSCEHAVFFLFVLQQYLEFELEKAIALTSKNAIKSYKEEFVLFEYLLGRSASFIEAITSKPARDFCKNNDKNLEKLLEPDQEEKVIALTNQGAQYFYETKVVDFENLAKLELNKIKTLTDLSPQISLLSAIKDIKFDELKDLDVEKITALFSPKATQIYIICSLSPRQLIDVEPEKINAIFEIEALSNIKEKNLIGKVVEELKSRSLEDIKNLTSASAFTAYLAEDVKMHAVLAGASKEKPGTDIKKLFAERAQSLESQSLA